ncbi:uncharacterized protein LOC123701437 [Colias croceus]|uniref:uncharacterized protein LOC123701437 n=1 Tax=Colias crocea TaxID=72248 RepID=UPI001E2812AE|nr:uncharacterized protein LOC123701437 [Colias croceus]
MEVIKLEMKETLGQKHRQFNKAVQNAIENNPNEEIEDIDYNKPDIDNLFKIDFACRTKNVDYLLKVLKCEDMLYVSRAIKHSVWLITDPKYTHIVNPEYLHIELFPYMLCAARNKLLYSIRVNLKDPVRNEAFLNYLKDVDLNLAMKWLPNCSLEFILAKLEEDIYRIPDDIFLRIFCVSAETLNLYIKNHYWKKPMLQKAMIVISKQGEKYFEVLDKVDKKEIPKFNSKHTKAAMKHCPRRLMCKFNRYIKHIDKLVFVKYIDVDCFQRFWNHYKSNKKFKALFPEEKCQQIFKRIDQNVLISRLLECSTEKQQEIKVVLYILRNKHLGDLKFRLKVINIILKKFHSHRFDNKTWNVLNDIYNKMGVYSQFKKHYRPCIKSAITYFVINNLPVPDEIVAIFDFDTFKCEQNKFNDEEKCKMFDFLYHFVIKKIETSQDETMLSWLENILILFKDWNKQIVDYPEIASQIESIIKSMKDPYDMEGIKQLYNRKRVWRIVLFQESLLINPRESACLNALKHDPRILYNHEKEFHGIICSQKDTQISKFLEKVRIYWPQSLATELKTIYKNQLHMVPDKRFYKLLSKKESLEFLDAYVLQDDAIHWNKLHELELRKHILKNIHVARPKPSLDVVLKYAQGIYLQDSFSSIKALLHYMTPFQIKECIKKLQNWPEFVQKLCVFQAFTKLTKEEHNEIITSIWNNTQFCSVRADIFKLHYKALRNYTKNDLNKNDAYHTTVQERWSTLKNLISTLTENESIIVYNLLNKFEKLPQIVRTDYCITSYKFLKTLPRRLNCYRFMNNIVSKIEYNEVLLELEVDFVAEIVDDTITNRIWTEKLDWTFKTLLITYITSQNGKEKQVIAFEKVLNPVFKKAYEMWHVKHQGLYMARFNIYSFVSLLSYKEFLEGTKDPILLILINNSFQENLVVNENYMIMTSLKLAIEYLKIAAKYKSRLPNIHEETFQEFSKICLKLLCDDVASKGIGILVLYHHALQRILNGFRILRKTQYKFFDHMLDLSKDLSSDFEILVHKLVAEHTFFIDYYKEDKKGRKMLHESIKTHPAAAVRAGASRLYITELLCVSPYYPLMLF